MILQTTRTISTVRTLIVLAVAVTSLVACDSGDGAPASTTTPDAVIGEMGTLQPNQTAAPNPDAGRGGAPTPTTSP